MRDSCEFGFFKKKFNCLITARRHGSSGRVSASQAGKDLSTAKKKKKRSLVAKGRGEYNSWMGRLCCVCICCFYVKMEESWLHFDLNGKKTV
jgi:hypothetical protein